jgi:hypothetical protein
VIVSGCVRLMPTPPFIMGGGWVPFGRWSDRWDGGAVARSPASAAEQEVAEDTVKIRHPRSGSLALLTAVIDFGRETAAQASAVDSTRRNPARASRNGDEPQQPRRRSG